MTSLEVLETETADAFGYAAGELGPYPHGDRFSLFFSESIEGMEYQAATVTDLDALPHEVFHSWVARGIRPLRDRDGWFDEAWTMYAVEFGYDPPVLSEPDDPVVLAPDSLWDFPVPQEAYYTGASVLATIADDVGPERMQEVLRDFYEAQPPNGFVTTEALESYLFCETKSPSVRALFGRYVYGSDQPPEPPPPDYCEGS